MIQLIFLKNFDHPLYSKKMSYYLYFYDLFYHLSIDWAPPLQGPQKTTGQDHCICEMNYQKKNPVE